MREELARRLVCPVCASELSRVKFAGDGAMREGVLLCDQCHTWYPIVSFVPVMLDFRTPFHETFAASWQAELAQLGAYEPPRGHPRPGEQSVQETFTEEWQAVRESDLSFTYSIDELKELHRRVWLKWAFDSGSPTIRTVLDVGCGLGGEAIALEAVLPADVIAVDLNFALLERAAELRDAERLHIVIASLFALPFRPESFDLVYSQGVLHHTYSTRDAFDGIVRFAGPRGHVFVWLYGREDHLGVSLRRGIGMRTGLAIERALRPLLSRVPATARNGFFETATRVAHPVLKSRMRHAANWERPNTNNYLRDWLSPRYAHRHGWNEVIEWFQQGGLDVVAVHSPLDYRQLVGDGLWGVGLTGRRRARD